MRYTLVLSVLPALLLGGCGLIVDVASDAWRDNVGSSSWAYGAKLAQGTVCSVEERSPRTGMFNAKFRDCVPCWTASYDEKLSDGGIVRCQIILPNDWNGKLLLVANDRPDGELPERAVAFAQDGTAVVCGDGGMGQIRRRNGRVNALAAGARRPSLRKAFFQEALALTLADGKLLATRKYGREPDEILCYGCESGGAQALFLVAQDPEAIDKLVLVNPAIDFAACAAYDLNIVLQRERARQMSDIQFLNLKRAAKELKIERYDAEKTNEFWSVASKIDDSFRYHPTHASRIRTSWEQLLTGGDLEIGTNTVVVPAVTLCMDFESRIRVRSWRMAWLFGESETGASVTIHDFAAKLPEMALYTPPTDLTAYFAAGGEAELILDPQNANVPAEVAQPLTKTITPAFVSSFLPHS